MVSYPQKKKEHIWWIFKYQAIIKRLRNAQDSDDFLLIFLLEQFVVEFSPEQGYAIVMRFDFLYKILYTLDCLRLRSLSKKKTKKVLQQTPPQGQPVFSTN